MIGTRAVVSAAAAILAVGAGLGGGAPRPEVTIGARSLIVLRANDADAGLAGLERALGPALDAARDGGARVIAGDDPPAPPLQRAADLVRDAGAAAARAATAVAELEAARRARDPAAGPLPPAPNPTELASIAGQLEASAEASDVFVEMRHRAISIGTDLEAALDALDDGDLAAAAGHVAVARVAHDAVAEWEVGFVTLPVWIDTTDAMIGAVERIVEAAGAGDAAAAEDAAADFAALADDGVTADRALRIALSEGGSSMTSTPRSRLAAVLAAVQALRATVGAVREAAAR